LCNNPLSDYYAFYELDRLSANPKEISISTKFMVSRAHRGSNLALRLMQASFRQGIEDGIAHTVFDCNSPLDVFFSRVGAHDHAGAKFHPDFGHVTVMRFDLKNDAEKFRLDTKNPLSMCFQEIADASI
jgi:hypothetical protein